MRKLLFGLLCWTLAGNPTAAERTATVLVTADRLPATADQPATVTLIDRAAIAASGAASLAELLRGRGGVLVRDAFGDGAGATLDLRGFGATAGSNTLVLVDGRRLNPASDSAPLALGQLDLDAIERVEILYGSAGARYGNQAVGGAINIVTRRAATPEAAVTLGSFGKRAWSARLHRRNPAGWGAGLDARVEHTDNYRRHNSARRHDLELQFEHSHASGRWYLELQDFAEDTQTPGALFLDEAAADRRQSVGVYANDFIDTRSRRGRTGLTQALAGGWSLDADLGWQEDDRDFVQSFRLFPGSPATQDRRTWTFAPRLQGGVGAVGLTLGLDLEQTDYLLRTTFGPQRVEQAARSVYGLAELPLGERWILDLGLRHARIRNRIDIGARERLDDALTVGSLGLVFAPGDDWRVRARIDQNYRFAKVDEHTNVVFGQPVGLANQRGVSYELGAEYARGAQRLRVAAYQLSLEDEISFDATGFVNVNLERTRRRGLNVAAATALGERLSAGFDYDWIDGTISGGPNAGRRIPQVPRHRLRLFAAWAAAAGTRLEVEGLWVSDQPYGGDFANRFPTLDAYRVVNLSLQHAAGPWSVGLRLNNLLDADYSESGEIGADRPGSGHPGCIADAFNDACPAVNPAPERNLQLTLRYQPGS